MRCRYKINLMKSRLKGLQNSLLPFYRKKALSLLQALFLLYVKVAINVVYYTAANPFGCCITASAMVFGVHGVLTPGAPTSSQYLALLVSIEIASLSLSMFTLFTPLILRNFLYERLGKKYVTDRLGENPGYTFLRLFAVYFGIIAIDAGRMVGNLGNEKALFEISLENISLIKEGESQQMSRELAKIGLSDQDEKEIFLRAIKNSPNVKEAHNEVCLDIIKNTANYQSPVSRLVKYITGS